MNGSYGFEPLSLDDEVAQGDLIAWHGEHRSTPWKTYAVIVTADCDLAWGKHAGRVSYVPAFTTEDYIWHIWRQGAFASEPKMALQALGTRLTAWATKHDPGWKQISEDGLEHLIRRVGSDKVLDELRVTDKGQRNDFLPLLKRVTSALALFDSYTYNEEVLMRFFETFQSKGNAKKASISALLQKSINQLPGDIFHFPCTGHDLRGLFVMLRHINQLSSRDIAAKPDDLRFEGARVKRLARMSATYRYALTQNLARVFADIGLPTEYDERCKRAAADWFERGKT